jgi:hypothetical protein
VVRPAAAATPEPVPDNTAAYEYAPGTEAEAANLLDVLSLFVPEEDDGADPEP